MPFLFIQILIYSLYPFWVPQQLEPVLVTVRQKRCINWRGHQPVPGVAKLIFRFNLVGHLLSQTTSYSIIFC